MQKNKVLVILNRDKQSGPNSIAEGMLSTCYPINDVQIKKHVFRNSNESLVSSILRLVKSLKFGHFSIVHTHSFVTDIICSVLAFIFSFSHVITVHNIPREDYLFRYGKFKGSILVFFHTFFMSLKCSRLVCISNTVRNELPHKLKKKSIVIHNFVSDPFFNKNHGEYKKLFYCGHFSKLKDPTFLIDSLKNSKLNFEFELFGDGELLNPCRELVEHDRRFNFHGRTTEIAKYYQYNGILIHSSNTEGFCLAVAEALASNMKVLVPDLKIFYEFKDDLHFSNIYIYKSGNVSSFEKAFSNAFSSTLVPPSNVEYLRHERFFMEHIKLYKSILKI